MISIVHNQQDLDLEGTKNDNIHEARIKLFQGLPKGDLNELIDNNVH